MTNNTTNAKKQPSNHSIFLYVVIALLILVILLLPPISLFERISGTSTTPTGTETTTLQTSDGVTLTIPPTANNLQANITSASSVAEQDNLPDTLIPLTDFYQIQHTGDLPPGASLTLPIPTSSETETGLDVYGWNGENWQWLPARQIPTQEAVEVSLDTLQQSIVVGVQAQSGAPSIAAAYTGNTTLPANFDDTLTELNPHIFTVNGTGQITSRLELPPEIQNADAAIIPTIRNWDAEDVASIDLILANPETRNRHAATLASLVKSGGYQGININYQDVNPQLHPEFTAFIAQLRSNLPADAKLSVQVDLPKQTAVNSWDSGAYDWQALGRYADTLKVPTLPNPQAYGPGGQMESLLNWATARVNRAKLQLIPRTGSSQWADGTAQDITTEQALAQIGAVALLNSGQTINPGQDIDFTLAGPSASSGIQLDEASGTYWFAYLDEDNQHHTIYLENPAAVANSLKLVQKYKLQGVDIQAQPDSTSPQWQALTNALEKTAPPTDSEYSVAWRVLGQDGSVIAEESLELSNPTYRWTAPEKGGAFEVAAIISAGQNEPGVSPDGVAINVLTPTPTPSPTPSPTHTATPSPTPKPTNTPRPTATPSPTPQPVVQSAAPAQPAAPAAPPPPAVPKVNVPFGYGIQTDPRGNTPGNIGSIKSLGFNWVKFQMAWKDVESQQGDYSWGMWDALIDGYSNNGVKVLLSIPKAPDWARPFDDDKSVEGPPADQQLYADFVAKVADRYRGRVQAIEVWNEQNLWYEAGGTGRINAATYVDLLQRSYRSIKAINPDMIVLSGALTPAGNVGPYAVDDVEYLQQMYNAGAKGYFDALGAHPSGYNCPALGDWRTVADATATAFRGPFENRHHSWCFRGTMESYREIMVANGDGDKAVVPTEFGWAVSGKPQQGYEYAADNTPEEQAKWVVEAYQLAKEWGWVGPMFLWNLDYGETAAGTELANFGILNTPAFNALAGMPK